MKEMKLANSRWIWASSQSCLRIRTGSSRGGSKKARYRRRNKIERMFCRLKGFRCIYSRVDRLDLVFIALCTSLSSRKHHRRSVNTLVRP